MAKFVLSQDFKVRADGKLKAVEIPEKKREELHEGRIKHNEDEQKARDLKVLNAYKAFYCAPKATQENLKSAYKNEKKERKKERQNPSKIKLGSIPQHMKEDTEFYYDTLLFFGNK